MTLIHLRYAFGGPETLGILIADGKPFCCLLEDEKRPKGVKVAGKTCIPDGTYEIAVEYSAKFKKDMVEIKGVPGFSETKYHAGVTVDDSLGCPLLRPLYSGATQGPKLTDSLVKLVRAWGPGKHYTRILTV
jgi:hypothetical protein